MRRPDDVPVNGKPAQKGARKRHARKLELCNHTNVAAPGIESGYHGNGADDDSQHGDKVLRDKPFEPRRSGRHKVVALHSEVAHNHAEEDNPEKGCQPRRSREPDGSRLRLGSWTPALEEPAPGSNQTRKNYEHENSDARAESDHDPTLVFVPGHALQLHPRKINSEPHHLVISIANRKNMLLLVLGLPQVFAGRLP